MKVILLKELQGKGGEGDVIDVNRGFANNFLLTQGYAVKATKGNLKQLEERKKNIAKREEVRIADANALAAKLNDATVTVDAQVGEEGVLFGSVTAPMVAEAIEQQLDIQIDRRRVELGKPIKMVGTYEVPVSLYRDIKGTVTVVVGGGAVVDEESAEAVDAFDEALEIAESPADETVEIDGEVSEDGTVEVEVTETEE
ncbi:50S ribosomal protein L9 [Adlercreutzia sp. R21]|uniref:50S ribosomal protein L9 n=1 Tax=Adlercreutzia wanghongyangiae TaxID=3111451 RepID=UPI002DBB4323|nr:50S ribosomal protein L9 [Adlercreutzia sp. R21]MEC4184482.1 50S ribosomal protein L9 [Adlercreutzia sp. R21]